MQPAFASTVVLLRAAGAGREVLLLKRPAASAFAADAWVFPGGRVDDADHELDLARYTTGPSGAEWGRRLETEEDLAAALVVAGVRETWEETGILLADGDPSPEIDEERRALLAGGDDFIAILKRHRMRLATDRLKYVGRRITPMGFARRFDTRFFLTEVPPDACCTLIGSELVEARWRRPEDALNDFASGTLSMMPPTIDILRRLDADEL